MEVVEEERQGLVQSQKFSRQGGRKRPYPNIGTVKLFFARTGRGRDFYIQQGKVKLTVISEQGKQLSQFVTRPLFRRRMSERSFAAHRSNEDHR
jgi:hypothetical protein